MAQKVLVVDDDTYLRDLYEEILKDEGFEVETAIDGVEGLTKLKKGGYDITLLDVMMPKLDGLGVLDVLSKNPPEVKNGPIILLTNLAHDPIIQDGLKKGAKSFIIKTDINPDELVKAIRKALG